MTAPLQLSALGERMNLVLQQGATFGPIVATMTNPAPPDGDGLPVNLTGCTIFGSIRKTAASTTVSAEIAVTITSAVDGEYSFEISAADTDEIPAGELQASPESQYVWDLFLEDATGRVLNLYYGVVQVLRRVTRPTP